MQSFVIFLKLNIFRFLNKNQNQKIFKFYYFLKFIILFLKCSKKLAARLSARIVAGSDIKLNLIIVELLQVNFGKNTLKLNSIMRKFYMSGQEEEFAERATERDS